MYITAEEARLMTSSNAKTKRLSGAFCSDELKQHFILLSVAILNGVLRLNDNKLTFCV